MTSEEGTRKTPITAFVITFNEERRLGECLASLRFADQLLVIDLGSTDRSVEIASAAGVELHTRPWVPLADLYWPDAAKLADHSWVLRQDPDEVMPATLADEILDIIHNRDDIGMVDLPHQYFFLGKPLKTTIWGGSNYIPKVFHRQRVDFQPSVHDALVPNPDFGRMKASAAWPIQHYWADSLPQLIEKHRRYIALEGEANHRKGKKFSWHTLILGAGLVLARNLFQFKGILGGWRGIYLSFFYTWYFVMSRLSLRRYERFNSKS